MQCYDKKTRQSGETCKKERKKKQHIIIPLPVFWRDCGGLKILQLSMLWIYPVMDRMSVHIDGFSLC